MEIYLPYYCQLLVKIFITGQFLLININKFYARIEIFIIQISSFVLYNLLGMAYPFLTNSNLWNDGFMDFISMSVRNSNLEQPA